MTWTKPVSVWLAPALVLALGVAVMLSDGLGIETFLSNRLFDAWQRHAPRAADAQTVKVLELASFDEDSLVGALRGLSGAKLVVLTAPLAPGASPQSLIPKLPPNSDAVRAALQKLPEPGHDLAGALRETKGVVPVLLGEKGRSPDIKARFTYRGASDPFAPAPRFANASAPPAMVESNADGEGAANLPADPDGVVRRAPLAFHLGNGLVPGLGAEALRLLDGKAEITVRSDERNPLSFVRGVGIAALETAHGLVPTDTDGGIRLHFTNAPRLTEVTSAQDAIVVIGLQGALVKTPMGPMSVAAVTAESIEGLLGGDVLRRPSWLWVAEAVLMLVLGAGMIWLLRFGLGWSAGVAMAGVVAMTLLSWYLYAAHSILADAATPSLVLLLAFAAGAIAWVHDLRLAYAGLRMAFADSLPRATIEKIARRPALLNIEGENRTVTYLVCGVRGQKGLEEAYRDNPTGFTSLMQTALTPLIDQALAHGGTIDRLTADGFTAFWNAPLDDAEHALHACEAANGMAIMSARVTEQLAQEARGVPPLVEIGVGIATGDGVAGAFGGQGRLGYSVHGDVVTLAQRVQAHSRLYGPALVIADTTKRIAERGFAFLEIDTIADENNQAMTLWAIMGNPVNKASPKFRALMVFHDHIFQAIRKQHWQLARDLIAQCRKLSGASQKLYDLHLARISWYERHPPGADWDGAFRPPIE